MVLTQGRISKRAVAWTLMLVLDLGWVLALVCLLYVFPNMWFTGRSTGTVVQPFVRSENSLQCMVISYPTGNNQRYRGIPPFCVGNGLLENPQRNDPVDVWYNPQDPRWVITTGEVQLGALIVSGVGILFGVCSAGLLMLLRVRDRKRRYLTPLKHQTPASDVVAEESRAETLPEELAPEGTSDLTLSEGSAEIAEVDSQQSTFTSSDSAPTRIDDLPPIIR